MGGPGARGAGAAPQGLRHRRHRAGRPVQRVMGTMGPGTGPQGMHTPEADVGRKYGVGAKPKPGSTPG